MIVFKYFAGAVFALQLAILASCSAVVGDPAFGMDFGNVVGCWRTAL